MKCDVKKKMMGEKVKQILEENDCDTSLNPPPANYETTDNPILPSENISAFDTRQLYFDSGLFSVDYKLTQSEEYLRVRKYYTYQLHLQEEQQMIKEESSNIKNILKTGNIDDIKEIFHKRRRWAESYNKFSPQIEPLCKVESCPNKAVPSSEYCIAHITNDPNQSLFVKCSVCDHMYPKTCSCFYCRNSD